jgi:hypothetical protein
MMDFYMNLQDMGFQQMLPFLLLYIGPETMLPLASALAAIGGVLLLFWHRFVGMLRRLWRLIARKDQ